LVREPERRDSNLKLTVEWVLHFITSPWSPKHEHLSDHHAISIRLVDSPVQ
jgi:hypothetical protein